LVDLDLMMVVVMVADDCALATFIFLLC